MLTGMVAANLLYDSLLVAAMLRHVVVPLYKQRERVIFTALPHSDGMASVGAGCCGDSCWLSFRDCLAGVWKVEEMR